MGSREHVTSPHKASSVHSHRAQLHSARVNPSVQAPKGSRSQQAPVAVGGSQVISAHC
jgi:hypothetical protein